MSSQKAFINLMTMYHWNETLFDRLQVPQSLDKDAVIVNILLETSDFPLVISDWDTLEFSMYMWSKHRVDIWQHFVDTTTYTYNPIENYDRHEMETTSMEHTGTGSIKGDGDSKTLTYDLAESGTGVVESSSNDGIETGGSDVTAGTSSNDTTYGGSDSITNSGSDRVQTDDDVTRGKTGSDTTTEGVSAFNNTGYDDHTRTITDYNSGDSENRDIDTITSFGKVETTGYGKTENIESETSETITYGKTETKNGTYSEESSNGHTKTGTETENDFSGKVETRNFADDFTAERYIHGNIGVTTTQEMIKQEREIADYDIIDIITQEFKKEFCILIYT